ncbi:hypothetical protein ACIP10_35950 [Streptomyces galbus]|uniref:hypothetical protein n=1 Tax=Streptomyces galbus TaxID=33898 RepID=UPI00380627C7
MHLSPTMVMSAVIVVTVVATATARGRWSGPWWLTLAAAFVIYPVSHTLLERIDDAPGGWLRLAFQVSCVGLVAILLAPVYHRLRGSGAQAGSRDDERSDGVVPSDAQ